MVFIKLRNNLNNRKFFWVFRKWIKQRPVFLFWKYIHKCDYGIEKNKNSFDLLKKTLPQFLKATVYAIFIIFILELYNYAWPVNLSYDDQAIDTFLSAVASISGVFLGLYFTAISGVASNFLIRASQDIREYFFSAPEGKQYTTTVAITGIVSVFYIVLKSFDHTIHPVGIIFLSLLASYIIIRFWGVGSNVFHFLEPSKSFPFITKDIAGSIKKIIPNRYQWNKDFFQNHHKNVVDYRLTLMGNIINFGNKEMKMPDEELIYAIKYLLGLLHYYSDEKGKIPTSSLWFKTKAEYTNWSLANSTEAHLALNTGTNLQPKVIKDYIWFEEKCLDIIYEIFVYFTENNKSSYFFKAYENLVYIPEIYAKNFDTASLKLFINTIEKINKLFEFKNIANEKETVFKEQIGFVDLQGMVGISAILGLSKYLEANNCDSLIKSLDKIKWTTNNKDIYLSGVPFTSISRLEDLSKELKNELKIEGRVLSKDWYIKTLCVQKYLFSLQEYFSYLKTINEDYFGKKHSDFISSKNIPLAIQINQRWLEFANKYENLVFYFKKEVENCNEKQLLKDLPWPKIDIEGEINEMKKINIQVEDKMISLLPILEKLKTGKDLPDYFGQALQIGTIACYSACKNNDVERLKRIMPLVFVSSISAHQITKEEVKNWDQEESKIIFSTEPIENLCEISGYSKLYSELFENSEIWDVVKSLWEEYFKVVNVSEVIKYFSAIFNYRDSVFKIMPQAGLRSNWKIDFENELRKKGFPVFPDDRSSFRRDEPLKHKSALIRAVAKMRGLMLSGGRDVFIATYLSDRPEANGVDLPDKHDFKEYIKREDEDNDENIEEYD